MAVIDVAGFVADLKDHAVEHRFHVHDERHFVESYSLRQTWEVDLHPEEGCEGPVDLYLSLEIDPRVLLGFEDAVIALDDEAEPDDDFHFPLSFTWALPPLPKGPDLLVLATELATRRSPTRPSGRCGSSRTRRSPCWASAGAKRCRATRSRAAWRSAASCSSTPSTGWVEPHSAPQAASATMLAVTMRIDCRHYQSRTYANGEAVRKCTLDLAPEAPWRCPDDCPKYERKMIDAGWQYGSLRPDNEPESEPVSATDTDVAALLDEAENIVNDAGFELLAEQERKSSRKLFRKKKRKR